MEVHVDAEAAELDNQITYLYNFRNGRSISSFGTVCVLSLKLLPIQLIFCEDVQQ
jgi:DNA mismatch repair protein MSH5